MSTLLAQLSEKHLAMLREESGLSGEIIAERGYYTETDFKALRDQRFSDRQALVPALAIPLYDVFGQRSGIQIRPDVPRFNDDGKLIKYESPRGSRAMIDVPPRCQPSLRDPSIRLHITEGAKKVDTLADRGLCAISLNGVWNWRGTNAFGGKTALADFEVIALNERHVRLIFDSDVSVKPSVAGALLRLKAFLERRGATVDVVYLPELVSGKTGIDDFLVNGGTIDELDSYATTKVLVPPASERPQVIVTNRQVRQITDDCWAAIVGSNEKRVRTFQTNGKLSRLDASAGHPVIRTFSLADIHLLMERLVDFRRITARGEEVAAMLPKEVASELDAFWSKPVPNLKAVVHTPVVGSDGRVSATPGYDTESELFYVPQGNAVPEVPDTPNEAEVSRARQIIDEWLCGFPFVSQASKAHAIAIPLTQIARELIDGPTPLFVVSAPTPGTGKTLFVETAGIIMLNRVPHANTQPRADDEWRKKISAWMVEGQIAVFIDNVKRKLESADLAAVLTATTWQDRRLGVNESITAANRAVWMATGNNVQMDLEIARRAVSCELDACLERPWEGRRFKHPDLKAWVREHRPELVWAYLVLIRNWVAKGCPEALIRLGMFESWSDVVGGTLLAADIPGFLENRTKLYLSADRESLEWHAFVERWWKHAGDTSVAAKDLVHLVRVEGHLGYLVERMRGEPGDHAVKVSLGRALVERRNRKVGDYFIRWLGLDGHSKAQLYRLEVAESEESTSEHSAETPPGSDTYPGSDAESAGSAESVSKLRTGENDESSGALAIRIPEHQGTPDQPPQTPQTPQSGSESVDKSAEYAAGSLPAHTDTPRCRLCGMAMSVVAVADICGRCKHEVSRG